jgi:hypothetical protein
MQRMSDILKNAPPELIDSPLQSLIKNFQASPFKVAPEREDELRRLYEANPVRILVDSERKEWIFEHRRILNNSIYVGLPTIERLWAYSYAYAAIVRIIQRFGLHFFQNPTASDQFAQAARILTWARDADLNGRYEVWSEDLPRPIVESSDDLIKHANHFFLMSAGRILLHEFAHAHLHNDRDKRGDSKTEEHEADSWADHWMLDKWRSYGTNELVFIGRCTGIVISHAPALHFDLLREKPSETHPLTLERIRRFIAEFLPTSSPARPKQLDVPCAFLMVILGLNVFDKGIEFSWLPYPDTYLDYIDRFLPYFGGCNKL